MRASARRGAELALALAILGAVGPVPPAGAAVELPGAGTVELAFTPGDAIDARIVAAIDGAEREVLMLAFSFTQQKIARALIAAQARGVAVEVVADRAQTQEMPHSAIPVLVAAGVPVWLDGNFAAAHNKVLVVDAGLDRATTVTGSYNFTTAAQRRNAENVAIFRDNAGVAHAYRGYFKRLQARAQRWTPVAAPAAHPAR